MSERKKQSLTRIVTREADRHHCRARGEKCHFSRYYKQLKTIRKGNCGELQGGNHYDRTTQHYINER